MSFWQWLNSNWVKVVSTLGALNSALITGVASGMFDGLINPNNVRWLGIIGFSMNAFLISVGFNNSTKEKVAAAFQDAINASPPPKQGGFVRSAMLGLLLLIAVPVILILPGCTSLGIPQPQTFNQKALVAYSGVTAATDTANNLALAGKLSKSDAQNVVNTAQQAKDAIGIAITVHASDVNLGDQKLQATLVILNALNSYLAGVPSK